ncbi:MAG TPA: alpha,alpha-trehalase TreF [Chitinophagaceae bacterium]|nr:alpha,alpha-trehalase TreF [Chitinophagaceae bacterium]
MELTNGLFKDVQLKKIFTDSKTFVDCLPKYPVKKIEKEYEEQKEEEGFDLKSFVLDKFQLPVPHSNNYKSDKAKSVEENINHLWDILTRLPDNKNEGTLLSLPYQYVVPGGRFGEIYYWDSYFTMLGLRESGKTELLESMVKNFSCLIDTYGYIPNGNRTYYLGRSQPPFYSLMINLLAEIKGDKVIVEYLPQLEKEYGFWMKGAEELNVEKISAYHVVRMQEGEIMNRYWDENNTPRPESYNEDIELAEQSEQKKEELFRHLRAGAESGWDYSSRWFKNKNEFSTIHTTDVIPVDLNCLLLHLEEMIASAYLKSGNRDKHDQYHSKAAARRFAIQQYCWNGEVGFYFDFDISDQTQKTTGTLAASFPLYFKIATDEQATLVADILRDKFLKSGGVVTTLEETGQQWDAPNGWAPLQWITIIGLENYGHHDLAKEIAHRWIRLNKDVFNRTGKFMEKYNVVNTLLEAGGGEYPGQDGFGWTNGILLALMSKYSDK